MILTLFLLFASAPQAAFPATVSAGFPADADAPASERAKESKSESRPLAPQPAPAGRQLSFLPGQLTAHALIRDAEDSSSSKPRDVQPREAPAAPFSPAIRGPIEIPSRAQRRTWYALSAVSSGAAAFDAWSTRRAISQGYARELNPTLRPFVHSAGLYAVTQASPLLMDFLGRRMMSSRHRLVRKMWWLPQSAGTAVSFASGVHNLRLAP